MTASSSTALPAPPARRTRARKTRACAVPATPPLFTHTPTQFWGTSVRCPSCGHSGPAVALLAAKSLGTAALTVQLGCKHELARDDFIVLLASTLSPIS